MTENEKASTFIGWQPGEICGGCDARMMDHGFSRELDENNVPVGYGHEIDAPDMSLPANYMAAFRELVLRGLFVEVTFYLAVGGPFAHYKIWPKEGQHTDDDEPLVDVLNLMGREPSAEVLTLAALYDAEHPQ